MPLSPMRIRPGDGEGLTGDPEIEILRGKPCVKSPTVGSDSGIKRSRTAPGACCGALLISRCPKCVLAFSAASP